MSNPLPFAVVMRMSGVGVSQPVLEARIGIKLDRYGPSRTEQLFDAQFDVDGADDIWPAIADCVQRVGPRIQGLTEERSIRASSLDLAFALLANAAMLSINIPSLIAEAAGRHGIDIDVSVYCTSEDE